MPVSLNMPQKRGSISMPGNQPRQRTNPAAGGTDTAFPATPGAYVLAIRLARPVEITARGLPPASLLPRWYAYAGSARGSGGLAARIRRHLAAEKRAHWHVDTLTLAAAKIEATVFPGQSECALLARLMELDGAVVPLPGFGASDCRTCPAHLVALSERPTPDRPVFAPQS
jgi:Uri superfamily endonuclease